MIWFVSETLIGAGDRDEGGWARGEIGFANKLSDVIVKN